MRIRRYNVLGRLVLTTSGEKIIGPIKVIGEHYVLDDKGRERVFYSLEGLGDLPRKRLFRSLAGCENEIRRYQRKKGQK